MPNTEDYYSQCEAALMTSFRSLPFFEHDWQVSDDDTVIAQGADYFAIFRPGAFPVSKDGAHQRDFQWEIVIDVYVRYQDYKKSWQKFKGLRAALINLVFPDPFLSATPGVWATSLSSGEAASYFYFDEPKPGVRPNFIIQTLTATITQRVKFDF